ncbi:MAG: M48 family metalloprotease, partial [Candidatus Methylomirabilis sp.]|nr:M48 family metalloprotease [Candidatus Methylomirabilis sp.]
MASQWSGLLMLLALAGVTMSIDRQARGDNAPPAESRASLAEKARHYFTTDELARGRAYARGRYLLYGVRMIVTLGLFGLLTLTPLSAKIGDLSVSMTGGRVWLTVGLYGLMVAALYHVVTFPVSLYGGFVREHLFGLSRQTLAAWSGDYLKAMLVNTVILLPLLIVLYAFIRRDPVRWYLPVWIVVVLVMTVLAELSPILFDPLFHTFRPVQDQQLVNRLRILSDRAGLTVRPILEIDAGRKTTKTNAYFTGFGRARRIVLYDTLLAASTPEEVELIVAHEAGPLEAAPHLEGDGAERCLGAGDPLADRPPSSYGGRLGTLRLHSSGRSPFATVRTVAPARPCHPDDADPDGDFTRLRARGRSRIAPSHREPQGLHRLGGRAGQIESLGRRPAARCGLALVYPSPDRLSGLPWQRHISRNSDSEEVAVMVVRSFGPVILVHGGAGTITPDLLEGSAGRHPRGRGQRVAGPYSRWLRSG